MGDKTNPPMPSEIGFSMDTNNDGAINLQELKHGMKEMGSPVRDAAIERFFNRADRNHDGEVDAEEKAVAEEAAAETAARIKQFRQGKLEIKRDAFEQEAVRMIDSLIARDIQEYKARDPKRTAFMQKVQHEGIRGFAASDVFLGLYKNCRTNENIRSGVHLQCILDDLQPLLGHGKGFSQIFVQMMFAQVEILAQRETL